MNDDTTELVARLRNRTERVSLGHGDWRDDPDSDCIAAADAIDRLTARVEELESYNETISSEFEGECLRALRSLVVELSAEDVVRDPDGWSADNAREAILEDWRRLTGERDGLAEALEPFAAFIGSETKLPDDEPMTRGSSLARRQVTVGDFRRARRVYDATAPKQE